MFWPNSVTLFYIVHAWAMVVIIDYRLQGDYIRKRELNVRLEVQQLIGVLYCIIFAYIRWYNKSRISVCMYIGSRQIEPHYFIIIIIIIIIVLVRENVLRRAAAPSAMHMKTSMTLIKIKNNNSNNENGKKTSKIRVKSPNVCPTWIKFRKNTR